jgi:type I restriction enzyme S subunit
VLKAAVEGKLTEEWRKQNPDVEPADKLLGRIKKERSLRGVERRSKLRGKEEIASPLAHKDNLPELPKGWVWATVGQLAVKVQYGSSAKTNENPSGVPVLRMGNIFEGRLKREGLKYLPKSHSEFPDLFLEKEDLLFNRTNSPELVGKTAVYIGNPNPCSFASYLIRVQFNNGASSHFVSSFINSAYGRNWIKTVVSQQVGQANVNGTKLQALSIPLPPAKEQKVIVEEIESLLSVTEEIEETIDINLKRAECLRQAILKKAFSGRL